MSTRATSLRTHSLSELADLSPGASVKLCGFHSGRLNDAEPDFDLVDAYGSCRVSIPPQAPKVRLEAKAVPAESAVCIEGTVRGPAEDRPDLVEISATMVRVLGEAEAVAFSPRGKAPLEGLGSAEVLGHRHLTLRAGPLAARLRQRHGLKRAAQAFLSQLDFIEVDLPSLTGWDAASAHAFVVPRPRYQAFGLNETGQLYKQVLMLGGCDRVYSFTRCFRDEGAFGPLHQPEYTALDIEMSWASEEDIYRVVSGTLDQMFSDGLGTRLSEITRLTWAESVSRYGTGMPDLRFGLEITELTEMARRSRSKILKELLDQAGEPGPSVHALCLTGSGAAAFDDDTYAALTEAVVAYEGLRLSWLKVEETTLFDGPLAEAFDEHLAEDVCEAMGAEKGDVILLVLSPHRDAGLAVAGRVRLAAGEALGLAEEGSQAFAWIHEIPYFRYSLEANCFVRNRHLLTRPMDDDLHLVDDVIEVFRAAEAKEQSRQSAQGFEDEPGRQFHRLIHDYGEPGLAQRLAIRSMGFELVLNGVEVGTGSIRNHDAAVQRQVMELLSGSAEEIPPSIRPLMDALKAGGPPHGGLSIGFDRLVALALGEADLRAVMAFPKDELGRCPMSRSPGPIQPVHAVALLGTEPIPLDSTPTDEHFDPAYARGLKTESVRVGFSFDPSPAYVGQPVQFVDRTESVVPVVDRVWSCPRIKWRSTLAKPKKRFSAPGEYEISLTVFLADGRKASAKAKVLISRGRAKRGFR